MKVKPKCIWVLTNSQAKGVGLFDCAYGLHTVKSMGAGAGGNPHKEYLPLIPLKGRMGHTWLTQQAAALLPKS